MAKGATEFGQWLCQQMQEHGIDQESLAEEIGMSDRSIRKYIYERTMPRRNNMKKIRDFFGTVSE